MTVPYVNSRKERCGLWDSSTLEIIDDVVRDGSVVHGRGNLGFAGNGQVVDDHVTYVISIF